MDDATVGALARLGLTRYEAKAYLALLGRESFTAAQVARQAELPRQRIYDVLASLVEKGIATTRPGTVLKYAATPPDRAFERLLERRRSELSELEDAASSLEKRLLAEFAGADSLRAPLEYLEVLRDRRAINERFDELQAQVENEILVFTKPPYARPVQENVEGMETARRAHVARSVYESSVFEHPAFLRGVERFIEAGEETRFVEELPLKLVIIDARVVMLGMQDPVHGRADLTIMVVEHPALASVLKRSFDSVWAEGMTLEEAREEHQRRRRFSLTA